MDTLILYIAHLRFGVYTCAAGGTILLYDILLTSEEEIRLIWPSKFSLVKCLYFVNRYLTVLCLLVGMYYLANLRGPLSTNFCKLVTISQSGVQGISVLAATWLLVIRVVALYARSKMIGISLYFVFISTSVAVIVLAILTIQEFWGDLAYSETIGICIAQPPRFVGAAYFITVGCEFVLVAMQLSHAYIHTRRLSVLGPLTPLLRTLYADGFAYFVVVAVLRLWSGIIIITADPSWWFLSPYLEFSLISISVSRLVLHLRRAAELHRDSNGVTGASIPLSHVSPNGNANNNAKFRHHDHHQRKPRRNHPSSMFHATYPSEIPQLRVQHLRGEGSIGSMEYRMAGAKGVDGSGSLLTVTDGEGRYNHESHDFDGGGVVEAAKGASDDRSDFEPLPNASPINRTERGQGTPPPPPGMDDKERRGYGYDENERVSSHGI